MAETNMDTSRKQNMMAWARELDEHAPPYAFVEKLFPYPATRRYPFHKSSALARSSFFEQCLQSPEVDERTKEAMQECTIIQATPVSRYLYEECDQENWRLDRDYPNIAPPFAYSWIECQAPRVVNSAEAGVLPWSAHFPMTWAIICSGADLWQQSEKIVADTAEQRSFLDSCLQLLTSREQNWPGFLARHGYTLASAEAEIAEAIGREPAERREHLRELLLVHALYQQADRGAWREVGERLRAETGANRWQLDMFLLAKYRASDDTYRCLGPLWEMQTTVQDNGAVAINAEGMPITRTRPLGDMEEAIKRFSAQSHLREEEGAQVLFEAYSSLFNPIFLALSFLHCKNVTLETRDKAPAARPRRDTTRAEDRPLFRYHHLNIEPMRRVLKTEGRAGDVGARRALHIARGHFRDYKDGRGLFGKYHGTYWIPQHVRGQMQGGIVGKEYAVKAPVSSR